MFITHPTRQKVQLKKLAKDLNRGFAKERYTMDNELVKKTKRNKTKTLNILSHRRNANYIHHLLCILDLTK